MEQKVQPSTVHYFIWNRTLTPVDNFSDNTKVSLNSKDCEAPESGVWTLDNDTEPLWSFLDLGEVYLHLHHIEAMA